MVIVDTGFWIALINRQDKFHARAREALKKIDEPLISTVAVITETSHLLGTKLGWPTLVRFIESLDHGLSQLFEIKIDHMEQIAKLMKKYRDLPMDFADASLVILAEHLGHGRILTTDQRKERKPFQNLLIQEL